MFDKIRRLTGHVLVYGFGNIGNRVVGFLLIPIYSRYLTPEDYGVLALVAMLGQILYAIMNMGQNSALFRTYFRHDSAEARERVVTTSLWLILTLSLPIGLLALALSKPIASLLVGSPAYTVWVALAVMGVAFKVFLRLPLAILRAREQSRSYAVSSIVQTIIGLALAIIFVVGLHLGGRGVLLSQLVAELALCVYLFPATLRGMRLMVFSRRDASDLLTYGLALVPAALLSFLIHLSDRYFLKYFVSVSAVGIYALGYRFGEILYFAILAFELAYPAFLFGHLKNPDAKRLYSRVCTYYFALMGILWLCVSLPAEEIVTIMAHPAYHDAYRVIPWIAGAFFFQGVGAVWNVGMQVNRIVKWRLAMSASTAVLALILNFLLIPRWGMMGAAGAALLAYVYQFVIQVLIGHRLYPIAYEWGRVIRLTVVGVGVYAVGSLITWGSMPAALAGKAGLLLCAPLVLYAVGFFEAGEVARFKGLVGDFRRGRTPRPIQGS
jgi:O-antigen/teichoic acid export membrane protein